MFCCSASAAVAIRIPHMKQIASEDFLYDTSYIAVWSTVEQCLAITAGCLATLQPLAKILGHKLGIASRPSLPGGGAGSKFDSFKMTGEISVRRSFTRRTETYSSMSNPLNKPIQEGELRLQPGISGYSAMCYNTTSSQEELRPAEPDLVTPILERNRIKEDEEDIIPVVRTREIRQ